MSDIKDIDRSQSSFNPTSLEKDDAIDKAFGQAANYVATGNPMSETVLRSVVEDPEVMKAAEVGFSVAKEAQNETTKVADNNTSDKSPDPLVNI